MGRWTGGEVGFWKYAIGSLRAIAGVANGAGDDAGDGAENRSNGNPDEVIAELDPEAAGPVGKDKPPSPDSGSSSSANASNEMRSDAFLSGLCLKIVNKPQQIKGSLHLHNSARPREIARLHCLVPF